MHIHVAVLIGFLAPMVCNADPTSWLSHAGKTEEWIQETTHLRSILQKVDLEHQATKPWQSRLQQRCAVLGRFDNFADFKRKLYLEQTTMMAEDLAAQHPPFRQLAGQNVPYVYWSETLRDLQGTRFVIPRNYDPGKEYQIFLYYKLGGGLVFKKDKKWVPHGTPGAKFAEPYQPNPEQCLRTEDTFHTWSALSSQVKGRMGQPSELVDMPAAFCADFSISPDRLFLSGFSDGGFDSLFIGFYYPDRVAGIAPGVANWQYTNVGQVGLLNVPTLVMDGWGDAGYVRENMSRFQTLSGMGYPIEARVGHHGHSDQIWATDELFFPMIEWARKHRRNHWPRHVRYATWNLHWHSAYWLSIHRMIEPGLAAMIDAEVKENVITISAKNVGACRLRLSDQLVNPKQKIQVVINGETRYHGGYKDELVLEISPAPPHAKWLKHPELPGGITVAADRSTYTGNIHGTHNLSLPDREWITVLPTNPHEAYRGFTPKSIRHDPALLENRNVLIIGTPTENQVLAKWADQLPVHFGAGHFSIGRQIYDQPEHAVRFVHPHPLNPKKYVIVAACNDPDVARTSDFYGLKSSFFTPSAYRLRDGDCVVYGITPPKDTRFAPQLSQHRTHHYTFTADWKVPDETPIGQATAWFDFESIQVLTADALRDVCEVDVGLVNGFPARFNQWRGWLPPGPVTFNDVATLRMLPEFISTANVDGKQLRKLIDQALAVSEVPPIKDNEIYRVASDYSALTEGGLTYVHGPHGWKNIPNPIHFTSMDDLQRQTGEVFPRCSNLKQTDMQVTEALVSYIKKHPRIAPRRFIGDLAKFVTNPHSHPYPSHDWLHAHIPFGSRSDSLHLGFSTKDPSPTGDVPRDGSQHFMALDQERSTYDFQQLAAGLPVSVRMNSETTPTGNTLLRIHLKNRGDRALTGRVILSAGEPQRYSAAWPDKHTREKVDPRVFGLVDIQRARGKITSSNGAVFIHDQAGTTYEQIKRKIAYSFGLLAIHREVDLPAKAEQTITLFVFDEEAKEPSHILDACIQRMTL